MQIAKHGVLARYGFALFLILLATLIRLPLNPLIGITVVPFLLYYPMVMISGWYGRFGAGIFATLTGALTALYLNVEPLYAFFPLSKASKIQLILFIIMGFIISSFTEALHRSNDRAFRSQETEQQQREWLQVTLKSVGDAVIATDKKGCVNFMNAVAESLTGWREVEAMGKPLDNIFHIVNEQSRERVENPVEKVLRLGNVVGLANHTMLIARDGREIPIDDSGAPIKDARGKTIGVVLVFHDISERSQAEKNQRLLFAVADLIRRATDADELLFTIARAVGEHLRARRCLFNEIDLEHDLETVHRDYCRGVESVAGVHKISEYSAITSAEMAAGNTVVNRDSKTDPRTAELYEQTYAPNGERAYIAVPLLRDNRWVASLWVSDDEPRQWNAQQINLLETIAERAWLAVEKLRNEKALRESEERLRLATEAVSIYSWEVDLRNQSFHWSENAERVANIPKPESIAAALSLIHPDDRADAERAFAQAIENRSEFKVEYRVAGRPPDDEMWGFTAGVVITAADGTPTRLVGITQDISERKRAEKAMAYLAAIVESSNDAIVSKTLDGIITSWNTGAEQMFGYTAAEMIGQPISRMIPPDRHAEEEEILRRLRAGEPINHYETMRVTMDGRLLDVSLTISPIKDNAGKIIGASKTIRDITERKRAERDSAFLATVGERIRLSDNAEELMAEVVRMLGEYLQASRCYLAEVFAAEDRWIIRHDYHSTYDSVAGEYRLSVYHPEALRLFTEGRVQIVEDTQTDPLTARQYEAGYKPLGIRALIAVPCRQDGTSVGRLGVFSATPRRFERREILLVEVVAERLWNTMEKLRAVQALRESEERLRYQLQLTQNITETAAVSIFVADRDGRVTFLNPEAEEVFGYTLDELQGEMLHDRIHYRRADGSPYPMRECPLELAYAGETVRDFEDEFYRKDGTPVAVVCSNVAIRENGDVTGVVLTVQDLTERKRAEERLRESEQRLAATYESAPIGIIECSPAGNYVNVNEEFCHIVGYTKEELLAYDIKDLTHRDDYPQDIRLHQQLVANEIPFYQIEKRFVRKDGAIVWAQLRRSIVHDAEGKPLYTIGAVQDITEKKRIEQERERLLVSEQQARRQAEEANRLKDEFLATVSHELRTPLNAILGWSRILRGGASDATILERAIETIERNARAQAEIVEDLLDVSRIITGNLRLDTQLVELPVIIQEALESVRPAAEAKEILLQTRFAPNLLPISGDPSRLRQIVWNLLSNAVKFTPRGGKVDVQAERLNGQIEIKISDTGSGISADFLPFVFDRFRQQDSSSTRKYGGLGLGLAIVRQLVELHGGTVEAQSNGEGLGAIFIVRLPLIANLEVARHNIAPLALRANLNSPSSAGAPRLDGLRVLVVDDETDTLDLVHTLLERGGAEVTGARSAAAALAILQTLQPDVLIADIEMPGEDGYSLIKKIRALPDNVMQQLPAIALTAYARTEDRLRALAAGFDAHIAKPMEPLELLTVIASLARRAGKGSA